MKKTTRKTGERKTLAQQIAELEKKKEVLTLRHRLAELKAKK